MENDLTEFFYYLDDQTRFIYWSEELVEDRPDLIFLGSSLNPDKKAVATVFIKRSKRIWGHTVLQLPN